MNRSSYYFHLISYFSVPASTALRFALRGAHLHLSKGCEGGDTPTIGACEAKPRHGMGPQKADVICDCHVTGFEHILNMLKNSWHAFSGYIHFSKSNIIDIHWSRLRPLRMLRAGWSMGMRREANNMGLPKQGEVLQMQHVHRCFTLYLKNVLKWQIIRRVTPRFSRPSHCVHTHASSAKPVLLGGIWRYERHQNHQITIN